MVRGHHQHSNEGVVGATASILRGCRSGENARMGARVCEQVQKQVQHGMEEEGGDGCTRELRWKRVRHNAFVVVRQGSPGAVSTPAPSSGGPRSTTLPQSRATRPDGNEKILTKVPRSESGGTYIARHTQSHPCAPLSQQHGTHDSNFACQVPASADPYWGAPPYRLLPAAGPQTAAQSPGPQKPGSSSHPKQRRKVKLVQGPGAAVPPTTMGDSGSQLRQRARPKRG